MYLRYDDDSELTTPIQVLNGCWRQVVIQTDGVTFGTGNMIYRNALYPKWNNRAVPQRIYGIK